MKRLGLAVVAAAALLALPLAAAAQSAPQAQGSMDSTNVGGQSSSASRLGGGSSRNTSKDAAAAAPAKISAADKTRGAKEAPPLVAASDVKTCQVGDAAFRGSGTQKGADGKSNKVTIYEVTCQTGPGYLVVASEGQPKPQMINCIVASAGAAGSTQCALPQNLDPKAALSGYVQQAGRTCDIGRQRYVGSTAGGATFYELGCTGSPGFLLKVSTTGEPPQPIDCLAVQGTPQACQFTTKEQILAGYQPAIAKSGKACQVSDVRPIGATKDGDMYTEIACGASPGFMLMQDKAGAFKAAIDCSKAEAIAGGCTMTNVAASQTADNATYTKLAAKAGHPCQVSKYRYIGQDSKNREVVELACSDHPDGLVAAFSETDKSDVYDCVRAGALGGQSCKLTDVSVIYPKYTEALASKGRSTCKVSGAGYLGTTTAGVDYVETACADGNPGWVIGFKAGTTTAQDLLTCRQASNAGLPCKLPSNTKG